MKKFGNLKTVAFLILGVLFIVSCEKSDVETETNQILETEKSEGFKSKTGNDGEILNIKETVAPVLKMHFDEGVPKNEAMLQFNAVVEEYISKQPKQANKGFSTEWFYRVWVKTGTQTNNQTNGDVGTYVRFTTSVGGYTPAFNWMDDAGDSLDGGWDGYLFRAAFPGQAIEWVEVDYGHLYLKGTDGWFVKEYVCQLWDSDQTVAATGFSGFWSHPNVWLDNDTSAGWDSYYSGNTGSGRINF
ncbi:hypothetical protein U6A24_12960 [Aquimarina gracilis]|uniref:Uncharacterized protein n=1 Tax=Aquimarina gracilis TaxID=874422 RepID=A0ABU5ZWX7_9FLAO|nr:hypothetical protein [Aquimarina gracilis]MEB3346379.1 hypothetical protein [Aquimarina gracilis]